MTEETIKIYVWPDNSWISEEDVDDIDLYIQSSGKSDDYAIYNIPTELESEDIEELISLKALPGMLSDDIDLISKGEIILPMGSILVIKHPKDIKDTDILIMDGQMIINSDNLSIKVLKGKK